MIKWEDQEELKIPASKDLVCLWMGQEDTKIKDLQDQSMLNTCICRKVLLTAHGKKQCHHKLVHFALREKNDQLLPYSGSCLFALLFQSGCAELPAELEITKSHFSPLHILLPVEGVPGSGWRAALPGTCEAERLCQGISSLSENWANGSVFGPKQGH